MMTNSTLIKPSVSLSAILQAIQRRQPVLSYLQDGDEILDTDKIMVDSVADLTEATSHQLSFLAQPRYVDTLATTQAGIVLVTPDYQDKIPKNTIGVVVKSPYLAYASTTPLFDRSSTKHSNNVVNIHPTAIVSELAVIASGVHIGAYCVIEDGVTIAEGCQLSAHVHIENNVHIGAHSVIKPYVNIAYGSILGHHVRIHANASIGSEGFGFAPIGRTDTQGWERIVQLGNVIIGNYVRIGSQTCIDRGAISDTIIEDNVIIDNLVQIAHNVHIGAGTAIAANTGVAGSTIIGKRCLIGGACGIIGHMKITDDVTLTANTFVIKSISKSGTYSSSTTAMPSAQWRRAATGFKKMGLK